MKHMVNSHIVVTFPKNVEMEKNLDYRIIVGKQGSKPNKSLKGVKTRNKLVFNYPEVLPEENGIFLQIRMKKGMIKLSSIND